MKLSELRDWAHRAAGIDSRVMTAIGIRELLVDIEHELVQAYHNGCNDVETKMLAQQSPLYAVGAQPMRKVVETERGADSYAMRSDDAPVGVWPVAQTAGQDRLKMLTEKLFSAVQRIEVLERGEIGPAQCVPGMVKQIEEHEAQLKKLDRRILSLRQLGTFDPDA